MVCRGVVPGVYKSWDEASRQVIGYPHNSYRGYPTKELAEEEYFKETRKQEKAAGSKQVAAGSDRVKNYIILFQSIFIVYLYFFYVM